MKLYYKRDGTPYPDGDEGLMQWAKDFENYSLKRVAQTILPGGAKISTVWLGLDHGSGIGKPLIFESMVFPSAHNFDELDCQRYSTEAEALLGHEELCKKWSVIETPKENLKCEH